MAPTTRTSTADDAGSPAVLGPYLPSARGADLLFLSGQVGKRQGTIELGETVDEQTRQSLRNLLDVLAGHGLDASAIVKCNVYLTDLDDFDAMNRSYAATLHPHRPARTTIGVVALPLGARVEIEAIARVQE